MILILADESDTRKLRRTDVMVVRVVREAAAVWIWSDSLRTSKRTDELYLFNAEPLFGSLAVNLGRLNWDWCYEGLALFVLQAKTFERNVGSVAAPTECRLVAGQTLREALDTAIQAEAVGPATLAEITRLASTNPSFLRSITSLESYLETIIVAEPESPAQPRAAPAKPSDDRLAGVRRLSIWTPGTSEADFIAFYAPLVGATEATQLWAMNRASITAVAAGQFEKQVDLGNELAASVPERSVLAGEAAYFKAEGLRLLADIEPEPSKKTELRAAAVEQYERASELLKDDPRPLRGLGRITELKGDFDGALKYFQTARGLYLTEMHRQSTVPILDLAHEVLRTTRHFIHCLLDIRATSSANAWHRVDKEHELEGYLQECENLHYEYMPRFRGEPEWYYIEWFMGFVFLAKAWGSLTRYTKMQAALALALEARRNIMRPPAPITAVQRANLEWWLAVARGQGNIFEADFIQRVDRLDVALKSNDSSAVTTAIEDILRPFASPWSVISDSSTP